MAPSSHNTGYGQMLLGYDEVLGNESLSTFFTDDGAVKQYCRDGVDLVPIPPTVQGSSDAISNLTSMEMWLRGFSSVRIPIVNVADTVCASVDVSIVILLWPCRPCLAFDYVGLHAYGYGQWIL